jgi:hypothetical protein
MKKNKFILLGLLGVLTLSSCGIFHKGCGCPTFGKLKYNIPSKASSDIA